MFNYAGVALMVEHLTCNQRVVGSNPASGSNEKRGLPLFFIIINIFVKFVIFNTSL